MELHDGIICTLFQTVGCQMREGNDVIVTGVGIPDLLQRKEGNGPFKRPSYGRGVGSF